VQYLSQQALVDDIELMFKNARHYNEENSLVYKDADTLERLLHSRVRTLAPIDDSSKNLQRRWPVLQLDFSLFCSKCEFVYYAHCVNFSHCCTRGDSAVIVHTAAAAAMLEVYYASFVWRRQLAHLGNCMQNSWCTFVSVYRHNNIHMTRFLTSSKIWSVFSFWIGAVFFYFVVDCVYIIVDSLLCNIFCSLDSKVWKGTV